MTGLHWTEEKTSEYLRKFRGLSSRPPERQAADGPKEADEGPESVLQRKIVKWAKEHGYPCCSFRQSRKARGFLPAGWPDVTILLPDGRVVFLELKSEAGKLRKEQAHLKLVASHLGHRIPTVKTWKRFIRIIECEKEEQDHGIER
jgi:hypothetical protein